MTTYLYLQYKALNDLIFEKKTLSVSEIDDTWRWLFGKHSDALSFLLVVCKSDVLFD